MIHYQLRCNAEHAFDGWFKDSTSFERQAKRGLLECPFCGSAAVERALMAPALRRGGGGSEIALPAEVPAGVPAGVIEHTPPPAPPPPALPMAIEGGKMPDQVRAALQRLRAEVEKTCDYVGSAFADEARKIHNGESDRRGIYGETSQEQAETLAEEGIEVARVPWIPRADG